MKLLPPDVCKNLSGMSSKPIGVGISVGSRFCKGEYNEASPWMLTVRKEGLRALSLSELRHESMMIFADPKAQQMTSKAIFKLKAAPSPIQDLDRC